MVFAQYLELAIQSYIRIRFLTEKLANWQLDVRTKKMVVDGVTD